MSRANNGSGARAAWVRTSALQVECQKPLMPRRAAAPRESFARGRANPVTAPDQCQLHLNRLVFVKKGWRAKRSPRPLTFTGSFVLSVAERIGLEGRTPSSQTEPCGASVVTKGASNPRWARGAKVALRPRGLHIKGAVRVAGALVVKELRLTSVKGVSEMGACRWERVGALLVG